MVEFPVGTQNFTGEVAEQLIKLHDAGAIRIMDVVILVKGENGSRRA